MWNGKKIPKNQKGKNMLLHPLSLAIINLIFFNTVKCSFQHYLPKNKTKWQMIDTSNNLIMPEYTFNFLNELKNWDLKNWNIFEWGSNHSTAWIANKCKKITSVTHNKDIYRSTLSYLRYLKLNNFKLYIKIVPEVITDNPILGKIKANIYADYGEQSDYVQSINETPDKYDCIFINGLHMAACAKEALKHTNPGCIIVINNVNRSSIGINLDSTIEMLRKYKSYSFPEGIDNLPIDRRTDYWIIN